MEKNWPADQVERRPIDSLIPYARNSRVHSEEQVTQIASSMKEWGWTNPVLIDEDGGIIAGHGRVMAAKKLGYNEVPCMVAEGWTEAQKKAYVIADNKLALNADWDNDLLLIELKEIEELNFDVKLTGFDLEEIKNLSNDDEDSDRDWDSEKYTSKIESPVYEIKGDLPPVEELYDTTKTGELSKEIMKLDMPDEVRGFLMSAATRHTVFNYEKIAEFYAHQDKEIKKLMEDSALVIIDFNKAIENGFVKLTKDINDFVKFEEDE